MKYETLAKKYQGKIIPDDGAYLSKGFKSFATSFRAYMKECAATAGWEIAKYNVGHYSVSGFLTKEDKHLYFSYSPGRHMPINFEIRNAMNGVLVRYAKNTSDYTGGMNTFCSVKTLESHIKSSEQWLRRVG